MPVPVRGRRRGCYFPPCVRHGRSLGMRQSPRGDRETLPCAARPAMHDRLNCWEKNRRKNVSSPVRDRLTGVVTAANVYSASRWIFSRASPRRMAWYRKKSCNSYGPTLSLRSAGDVPVFGGQQLGADRGIEDRRSAPVQAQRPAAPGKRWRACWLQQRLWHVRIDAVHRHVVSVEGGPAERNFRQVAPCRRQSPLHMLARSISTCVRSCAPRLRVFKGGVRQIRRVADIPEVLGDRRRDVHRAARDAKRVAQLFRIAARARGGAKARRWSRPARRWRGGPAIEGPPRATNSAMAESRPPDTRSRRGLRRYAAIVFFSHAPEWQRLRRSVSPFSSRVSATNGVRQ